MELKQEYKNIKLIESIYTGGAVKLNKDFLFTTQESKIKFTKLDSDDMEEKEELDLDVEVSCFAVYEDYLIVALKSLQIAIYQLSDLKLLKTLKLHDAPTLVMDTWKGYVASGSADSTIKIIDIKRGFCTHSFKGHGGVISALCFSKDGVLASGSDDCTVRIWDLYKKSCVRVLKSHVSVVRGLAFDGDVLFSGGRDKVIIKWDYQSGEQTLTVPVLKGIEALKVVEIQGSKVVLSAGEEGILQTWDPISGHLLESQEKTGSHSIISLEMCEQTVVAICSDQNIQFFDLDSEEYFKCTKQIAGYNEEILDIELVGETDSHLAVITNTEQIRLYSLDGLDCDIVHGHSDIVLCLSKSFDDKFVVTGSKDQCAKVWSLDLDKPLGERLVELETLKGHTGAVSAITMPKTSNQFVLTASQDRTIKCWNLEQSKNKTRYTFHAHDKDIQSLDVSPNDQYLLSASLDKTAKMWNLNDGSLVGEFKGHKRGLWCAKFSPVDQMIATGSTDKTIKIWNIRDFTCVRTLEGHLNTVLDLGFLSAGMQLLSTGSDGLMKLWTLKSGECVNTFDNHEDRIWTLSISKDESRAYSGSSDSTITIWQDHTRELNEQKAIEQQETDKHLQDLQIFLKHENYTDALVLALELDHPSKLLDIFMKLANRKGEKGVLFGSQKVEDYIKTMPKKHFEKLVYYLKNWNTNQKYLQISQMILKGLHAGENKLKKEDLDALLVYSRKHYQRVCEDLKDCYLVDFIVERMQ